MTIAERICKTCKEIKPLAKNRVVCINCFKDEKVLVNKKYNNSHRDQKNAHNREIYIKTKEYQLERKYIFYKNNSVLINIRNKKWKNNNKEYILKMTRIYRKERVKKDPSIKIRENISRGILYGLTINGATKEGRSIFNKLPYSYEELKIHISSKFENWMTWNNHGKYITAEWDDNDFSTWTWQIDHIIPHSIFKYTSMDDQAFKDCWALNNLRPLSSKQNVIDGVYRNRHKKEK